MVNYVRSTKNYLSAFREKYIGSCILLEKYEELYFM